MHLNENENEERKKAQSNLSLAELRDLLPAAQVEIEGGNKWAGRPFSTCELLSLGNAA